MYRYFHFYVCWCRIPQKLTLNNADRFHGMSMKESLTLGLWWDLFDWLTRNAWLEGNDRRSQATTSSCWLWEKRANANFAGFGARVGSTAYRFQEHNTNRGWPCQVKEIHQPNYHAFYRFLNFWNGYWINFHIEKIILKKKGI